MNFIKHILFVAGFIFSIVTQGESIKCYDCNSIMNKDCADDPHSLEVIQCPGNDTSAVGIPPGFFLPTTNFFRKDNSGSYGNISQYPEGCFTIEIQNKTDNASEIFRGCTLPFLFELVGTIPTGNLPFDRTIWMSCEQDACNSSSKINLTLNFIKSMILALGLYLLTTHY